MKLKHIKGTDFPKEKECSFHKGNHRYWQDSEGNQCPTCSRYYAYNQCREAFMNTEIELPNSLNNEQIQFIQNLIGYVQDAEIRQEAQEWLDMYCNGG